MNEQTIIMLTQISLAIKSFLIGLATANLIYVAFIRDMSVNEKIANGKTVKESIWDSEDVKRTWRGIVESLLAIAIAIMIPGEKFWMSFLDK